MSHLLERDDALAGLRIALEEAARGRGGIVVVGGEPGIGKTTLLEHFVHGAPAALLLWGACEALATPRPLGPLHDWAGSFKPLRQSLASTDGAALFQAVLDVLSSTPAPVLLVIEDLHWADDATLDLVRFLGRRIHRTGILLLLSCRDDALSWTSVRPVIADLLPSRVRRIALRPLSGEAVRCMAQKVELPAGRLHEVTGGNPFFVSELLHAGGLEGPVPATVRDAVLARVGRLPEASRRLLELASLFPRAVELELLQCLEQPALEALDACVSAGLLVFDGVQLSFRHELARVAVETAIPPAAAAALHRKVLQALSARPEGSVALARLAHHARLAWDEAAVLKWTPRAAAEAARRGARREAVEHCRAALRCGSMADDTRAGLLQEYATQCFELNQLAEAIDAYRQAIALHRRGGNLAGQVECLSALSMPLVRTLRNAEAEAASRAALELAERLPPGRVLAGAYANESYLCMLNRDCRQAIEAGERAIALASEVGAPEILARAYKTVGSATFFLDYAKGCELVERSLALAGQLQDGGAATADAYLMLGTASAELMELDTAERYLEEGIAFARAHDLDRVAGYMEAWQSLCDLFRGRWEAAGQRATRLLSQESYGTTNRVMALLALGRLRSRRGDPGGAEVLDEALQLASHSGTLQRLAPVCATRAEAAWLAGDLEAVAHEANRAYALADAKSHAWYSGELAHWLWRAGRLARPPQACAAPYALQIAGRWQEAAAAWGRLGCPFEQARCLLDGDASALRQGVSLADGLSARPLAQRLRDRMRAAGMAAVPRGPQTATRANPAGLTAREAQVLELLSAGLRNAEIASRLSRSVRTVDHHVEAVCRKLGCSSRTDAVEAGRRLGLLPQK